MDPVLSSTIDFNEYINANLNLTGRKATLSDLARGRTSKPSTSGASTQSQRDHRPRSAREVEEYAKKELSQDFLQLNVRKYDKATAAAPPRSQSARGARPKPPSPEVSPTARIPLQHSWKAHVSSRVSPAATGSSRVEARRTSTRPGMWEDDGEHIRPTVPVPYSSTRGASSTDQNTTSISSARRPVSAALPNRVSVSYDDTEFGLYKVRLVTLKRLFTSWAAWCADSQRQLAQRSRDVLENRLYWPKQSAFSWWTLLYRADRHAQSVSLRRAVEQLWRKYKITRRRRSLFRRAHRHFEFMKSVQFLRALAVLARRRRRRLLSQGKRVKAHDYRTAKLTRRVLGAWKQMVHKVKNDRLLDAEQSARRDKIAMFMRRVQTPASGPVASTPGAPVGDHSEPPPSGRRTGGAPSTATTTAAQERSRTGQSGAQSKLTRSGTAGGARNGSRTGTSGPQGTVRSVAESKGSDEIRRRDAKTVDIVSRSRAEDKDGGDEYSDEFELPDSDGEDGGDGDLPPPSYDALVQPTPQSRSSGGGRAAVEGFRADSAAISTPRTAPGKTPSAHGYAATAERTLTVGPGFQETAGMTLEERAAARRQRTLLLKKQAEERIQEKSQQKLAAERLKQQKELEEAEMIRKEARAKQLEAKATTDRHRAESAEVLRALLSRAKRFRAQQLLVRWGFAPWQQYMELVRINFAKADEFRADRLLQSAWSAFFGYIVARRTERFRRESRQTALAVAHYRRKLLKFVWRTFRLHHKMLSAKSKALTGHFSRFTLSRRSFLAWRVAYERSIRQAVRKLRSVQPRGDLLCKRHYFRQWCAFHAGMLEEREIRHRVNSKWAAVQSWMS